MTATQIRFVCMFVLTFMLAGFVSQSPAAEPTVEGAKYLQSVCSFADTTLRHGRDTYGDDKTPLFVDGLHVETLEPVRWKKQGETWVLSNFASQQTLMRTLDGLTALSGEKKYRAAAEDAARCALERLQAPSGLLYWGGHLAWDLDQDKPVGQGLDSHELKGHQPYYRLMHRVDAKSTIRLMGAIWAGHILDWSRLDYNRHASVRRTGRPTWDHPFDARIAVPFPSVGGNLSFCNVTPPLIHAGTMLAILDESSDALLWTDRLVQRWQQGRDPKTGLCGGQLSYREHDRAQDALGHVHPTINEAKIVASYHQSSRYHDLPLVQLQAAQALRSAGGTAHETLAQRLIDTASEDLTVYARECYDAQSGHFVARMTDGTALEWKQAKTGYYVPSSFAPRRPDGSLFWGYALAYRMTGDAAHKKMIDALGRQFGLWESKMNEETAVGPSSCSDWRVIYALLELQEATNNKAHLALACQIADNLLKTQTPSGLFPRARYKYARTGDDIPLALLHLSAALRGRRGDIPRAVFDRRFFHCEYHGDLEKHQQKRADARTYDHLVFYGS